VESKIEAIVVGCSASGAIAARDLAAGGVKTVVLEEHASQGKQGKCSGLVSKRGLKLLGVDSQALERCTVNEVRGALLHAKNGATLRVERRSSVACVLDRQLFDEALAAQAAGEGAKILLKHRVTAVKEGGDGVRVWCGAKRFESKFVLGADGAASPTAASPSLGFPKIPRFVLGYETEFDGARVDDPDFVQLFFDSRAFPGFFAWLIPSGKKSVRAGFATGGMSSFAYSKNAFHRLPAIEALARSPWAKRVREYTHVIPVAPRPKTQSGGGRGRVLLAGDAAGQVKATTGGGIVFGGLCAREAALCVKNALDSNELPDYERSWRKKYGATLALHSALRKALNAFGNRRFDFALRAARFAGAQRLFSEFGDMDFVLK